MVPKASLRGDDGFELARLDGPNERTTIPTTDQAINLDTCRAPFRPRCSRDAVGSGRFILLW